MEVLVCGPAGASGVTYATVANHPVSCGTDPSTGASLGLQVWAVDGTPAADQPVVGGESVGLQIGMACLSVLAGAWALRKLMDLFNSSGET